MRNKIKSILVLGVILIAGCYYDKEDLLYPDTGNCDTSNSTYSLKVLPALQTYGCIGCHSGSAPSGNVLLDNHANVKIYVQNGKLYGAISHTGGYSPMPQGGNKMNNCTISQIKAWIDAGALNN